jgi:hypothetical protein
MRENMRTHSPEAEDGERRAVKRSVEAVPERVALWDSIVKEWIMSLFQGHLIAIIPKRGGIAIPLGYRTVAEQLDDVERILWNICVENRKDEDLNIVGPVYQNIRADIEAFKSELYAD